MRNPSLWFSKRARRYRFPRWGRVHRYISREVKVLLISNYGLTRRIEVSASERQEAAISCTCGSACGEKGAWGVAGALEVLARPPEWEEWLSLRRPPFLPCTQSRSGRRQGAVAGCQAAHKGPSDSVWGANLATAERKWRSQLLSPGSTHRVRFREYSPLW